MSNHPSANPDWKEYGTGVCSKCGVTAPWKYLKKVKAVFECIDANRCDMFRVTGGPKNESARFSEESWADRSFKSK